MAEEQLQQGKTKSKGLNFKMLIIGVPLFIIQLVLVYVITANILLEKMIEQKLHGGEIDSTDAELLLDPVDEIEDEEAPAVVGQFIFNMDDVVVNPAGTNGQKFLLISMGFDVPTQVMLTEIEAKQILVKDLILRMLAEKNIDEVSDPLFKDKFKEELIKAITELLPEVKVTTIYFSKYIIN